MDTRPFFLGRVGPGNEASNIHAALSYSATDLFYLQAGILCVICEFVMKELESILINNATEVRYPPTSDLGTLVCSM